MALDLGGESTIELNQPRHSKSRTSDLGIPAVSELNSVQFETSLMAIPRRKNHVPRKETKFSMMLFVAICLLTAHPAFSQTPYYAGKTITMIRGGGPGGSGEFQSRALMPYLKKYIPGNPTIMMEFMDGASGRKAANYLYTAKPDGLKIGSAGAMIPGPILGLPGSNYDIDKFIYLGSTETGNPYVLFTRKATGIDSLEKLPEHFGDAHWRPLGGPFSLRHCADVRLLSQFQGPQIRRGLYRPGNGCRYGRRRAGCQDIEQC